MSITAHVIFPTAKLLFDCVHRELNQKFLHGSMKEILYHCKYFLMISSYLAPYIPWSLVSARIPAVGDALHVVHRLFHLVAGEALGLLGVVGARHGGVGVARAGGVVVEGATLGGLGHAPHGGHHGQALTRRPLVTRHP